MAPSSSGNDPLLLGDANLESADDRTPAGSAEAFSFVGQISGTPTSISVYVGSQNGARTLIAGLYSDSGGRPASLLAAGSLASPQAGAWNAVGLSGAPTVTAGTNYWVAVLGKKGNLYFRVGSGAGCSSQTSTNSRLNSLPSSWQGGQQGSDCPISAYVDGTSLGPPVAPPVNTVAPTISGTAVQGSTLTTSNGSWLPAPSAYAYQWQDCDASGSNCAAIGGAIAATYTLTANDVGHTVRSNVTGTNSAGSTVASSRATGVVVAPAAPTAAFTYSPTNPTTGQTVHFDSSAATCAATPCSYTWADNPPSGGTYPLGSGLSIDFTFQVVGTKYVTLTMVDALNRSATVEHNVVVTAPPSTIAPPTNSALPTISGTAVQGQTLSSTNGSWSGSPTSYAYQWRQCDTSGNNCASISGATSSNYTLTGGDVGHTVRVVVTATNAGGSTAATSNPTSAVAASSSLGGGTGGLVCSQHVTTSTFASAFSAAGAGAVLCLAPGNYGNFSGSAKTAPGVAITSDQSAGGTQANVIFTAANLGGATNIRLDDLTLGQSANTAISIQSNPTNVAVTNAAFKGAVEIDNIQSSNHQNVVFNHDDFAHTGLDCSNLANNGVFALHYSGAGHSGVTVENSAFGNTDCDGIHTGTGLDVLNNTFTNICEDSPSDPQHTDNMQFEGAVGGRVAGNYFHEEIANCITQGLTSYDGGTNGVLIEDNVVDIGRPWGIEWYGDINSTIRHNTVVYRASGCEYGDQCGWISIDCRSSEFNCGNNAAYGTQVYDNIAMVTVNDGAKTARNDHNYNGPDVTFQGGSSPPPDGGFATFLSYLLAPGSAGKGAADDGSDLGITGPG